MAKTIVLVTSSFPYGNGEQFLETEVQYWAKCEDIQLIILPLTIPSNSKRVVDNSIIIDTRMKMPYIMKIVYRILFLGTSFFSHTFYKELTANVLCRPIRIIRFFSSISRFTMFRFKFNDYLQKYNQEGELIVYTYWNTEATYALQTLKEKFNFSLVSRIHGGDLYQEVRYDNYMPLKKLFTKNIDKLFTITDSAKDYLHTIYGFEKNLLQTSRLGVIDKSIVTKATQANTYHIISCAFMSEVKNIDKIVDAIYQYSTLNENLHLKWTHIGDGLLFHSLKQYTRDLFSKKPNLSFEFLGNIPNNEIYAFYQSNTIDVFINTSKSEGVPVSIMEAMSCHIPIIAPNIGGISDMLIDQYNGILLSKSSNPNEIVNALSSISMFKNNNIRLNSYRQFKKLYDADKNYQDFINTLIKTNYFKDLSK